MEAKKSSRNHGKPPICRIASLNGFDGVLIGRDMGGIFQEGHVYSAVRVLDEIVITDLGVHAIPEYLEGKGKVNQYLASGVVMLTVNEYKKQKELESI